MPHRNPQREAHEHKRGVASPHLVKMLGADARLAQSEEEPTCNPHPDAPHGFNRNASHNAGRYVCECEGWRGPLPEVSDSDMAAFDLARNVNKGERLARVNDQHAKELDMQHLDTMRCKGAL